MEKLLGEGIINKEAEEGRKREIKYLADLVRQKKLKSERGYKQAIGRVLDEAGIKTDRQRWFSEIAAELGRRGGRRAAAAREKKAREQEASRRRVR